MTALLLLLDVKAIPSEKQNLYELEDQSERRLMNSEEYIKKTSHCTHILTP